VDVATSKPIHAHYTTLYMYQYFNHEPSIGICFLQRGRPTRPSPFSSIQYTDTDDVWMMNGS